MQMPEEENSNEKSRKRKREQNQNSDLNETGMSKISISHITFGILCFLPNLYQILG